MKEEQESMQEGLDGLAIFRDLVTQIACHGYRDISESIKSIL